MTSKIMLGSGKGLSLVVRLDQCIAGSILNDSTSRVHSTRAHESSGTSLSSLDGLAFACICSVCNECDMLTSAREEWTDQGLTPNG